ncbi:MAG: polyribonucleotide nucleotidyltransferase [bacterium]|nr:polyribonucleotide nucleotidyltransferase [bacterium]
MFGNKSGGSSAIAVDKEYTVDVGDQKFVFKTGMLAAQANATVVAQSGDTVCMSNCTTSRTARAGVSFLPLQVVYQEKFYAAGKVAGSRFRKREGRPADSFVLTARVIDRGLRPMFAKTIHNDIQVFCTVLSYDFIAEHDIVSANAASLAVALSDCPADGPVGTVRVGLLDGNLVLNPTHEDREKCELDMIVTATEDRVVMIDAAANQVPEAKMLEAILFGQEAAQKIAKAFADIQKEIGSEKWEAPASFEHAEGFEVLKGSALAQINKAILDPMDKLARRAFFGELADSAAAVLEEKYGSAEGNDALTELYANAGDMMNNVITGEVRRLVLEEGKRMSGRTPDEIRPVGCIVDILPARVHGSALFQRGETQGLTTCTLGAPGDKLMTEGMMGEKLDRYFHHYNFPPFSVGETSNRLFTGNREIGHGYLAQKALEPVLPPEEVFPYTIRTVTEILESNGSSSMAATCGSTLALMAAGVPISAPVSGIAMGLMSDPSGKFVVLSDLQDEEDFGGDMDFKVTGTAAGVTAIQMDIKVKGLPDGVFKEALEKAKIGRASILKDMLSAIPEVRSELSKYAPRIETINIDPDDIRLVIGKGGETIQGITKEFGVNIDIEDSGMVFVTAPDGESMAGASARILNIVAKPEVGTTYDCKIVRVIDGIGAIAEFLGGKDGMIHISELQWSRTENVEDIVKVGDEVKALCVEYSKMDGKTRLSIKQLQDKPEGYVERAPRPPRSGGDRRGPPRR